MKYTTKDSGKREEYITGMVRDTQDGKPDFSLCMPEGLPYEEQMLTRWAELMERGRLKYGRRNWEKASTEKELERFKSSALRHMMQWMSGETDEDHAAAVFFNITAAEYVKAKMRILSEPFCAVCDGPCKWCDEEFGEPECDCDIVNEDGVCTCGQTSLFDYYNEFLTTR